MDVYNPDANGNGWEDTINIREYIALFWQWAWVIALVTVLAAAGAYFFSQRITPVYQASTTVLVNEAPSSTSSDYSSLLASERLTGTYTQMFTNSPVLNETIEELGLTMSPTQLRNMITVSTVRDTNLIRVSVESTDPYAAAVIADTLVRIFSEVIQGIQSERFTEIKGSLETQLADTQALIDEYAGLVASASSMSDRQEFETRLAQYRTTYASLLQSYEQVRLSEAQTISSLLPVEPAAVPTTPISPKVLQNTGLAAAVGFLLSAGVIVAVEALDDTIKTPEDVTRHLGLPVLGMIDRFADDENEHLITVKEPRNPVSESFRALRTNVQFASVDRPLRTLLVTSPGPSEGKSTMAANLSVVFAQSGRNTFLLDCDFRRPKLHTFFDMSNRFGLSSLLYQPTVPKDYSFRHTSIKNLNVMTSGGLPPNPAELLASERMRSVFQLVLDNYEMVVMDSPPILAVTDASILAPMVDGVLLVVQPGKTHISAARQTVEQLRRANARILGVAMNRIDLKRARYAYRYGYHYYGRAKYAEYYRAEAGDESPAEDLQGSEL